MVRTCPSGLAYRSIHSPGFDAFKIDNALFDQKGQNVIVVNTRGTTSSNPSKAER